jgi:hypothetical protein
VWRRWGDTPGERWDDEWRSCTATTADDTIRAWQAGDVEVADSGPGVDHIDSTGYDAYNWIVLYTSEADVVRAASSHRTPRTSARPRSPISSRAATH